MTQAPIQLTRKQRIMSFFFWFLLFYAILLGLDRYVFKKDVAPSQSASEVIISTDKRTYRVGNLPHFTLVNRTDQTYKLKDPCLAGAEKLQLVTLGDVLPITCEEGAIDAFELAPQTQKEIMISEVSTDVFQDAGNYKIRVLLENAEGETQAVDSEQVVFKEPGIFRTLYRNIITKPLFNILVFFVDRLPNHSFGISIILLTIVVRILLLIPNQKAMKSQREMQKVQPKIAELKQKYKDNQQMLAMKQMELYKTHKINPMSSCLPILLQMPFLIGLYHIVLTGLAPHMAYFLYTFQKTVDLTIIDNMFLGMDLTEPNKYILPLIVGVAQWVAFRMTMIRQKKSQAATKSANKGPKEGLNMQDQMAQMNVIMQWALPVMIVFFTSIMPAGVGIYWLTSTLFGIAQQWVVNHEGMQPKVVKKES